MEKFLSPEEVQKVCELAQSSYRPKEIVGLKNQIEGEIHAAELNYSVTGVIDHERIQRIVSMKLELDGLYVKWARGIIS
ncbi:MAG: hypothetical protein IPK84_04410 [Candidatus Moraniibacteriota bacterium]|nr:MAG: hypothetical protein IPK84_04410 [Candidatus Moranbacteria bacterium]